MFFRRFRYLRDLAVERLEYRCEGVDFRNIDCYIRAARDARKLQRIRGRINISGHRVQDRHVIYRQVFLADDIIDCGHGQDSFEAYAEDNNSDSRFHFRTRFQRLMSAFASVRGTRHRLFRIDFQVFMRGPRSLHNIRQKAAARHSGRI